MLLYNGENNMPAIIKFKYIPVEGQEFVTLQQWVETTLTPAEKEEFTQAVARMKIQQDLQIENGNILSKNPISDSETSVVWKDQTTREENTTQDSVWLSYFDRWVSATGTALEVIETIE